MEKNRCSPDYLVLVNQNRPPYFLLFFSAIVASALVFSLVARVHGNDSKVLTRVTLQLAGTAVKGDRALVATAAGSMGGDFRHVAEAENTAYSVAFDFLGPSISLSTLSVQYSCCTSF